MAAIPAFELLLLLSMLILAAHAQGTIPRSDPRVQRVLNTTRVEQNGRYCVNFTPYVSGFSPGGGPEPSRELVASLLDGVVAGGQVKCLFTYGTQQAYGEVPALAQARGIKVVQNIWLEGTPAQNTAQVCVRPSPCRVACCTRCLRPQTCR